MIAIDYTIHLSDVVMVMGGIASFVLMFQRVTLVLNELVKKVEKLENTQGTHQNWLVQMRTKLGFDGITK